MHQRVICVLGMHRSGTSCLTGSLQAAGLYLGEVNVKNRANQKGNRENTSLNQLNESVLQVSGGSWSDPPANAKWSNAHYDELCNITRKFNNKPLWGFKDPRSLFLLKGLQRCIPHLEFVGTFRNPVSVAVSLERRNAHDQGISYWLNLWQRYNRQLLEVWRDRHFPIINFDQNEDDYLTSISTLIERLELPLCEQRDTSLIPTKATPFFDVSLRTSIEEVPIELPKNIQETYKTLQDIAL